MKYLIGLIAFGFVITSCVPAKKYNELLDKEQACADDLDKYKKSALDCEGTSDELNTQVDLLRSSVTQLEADTTTMGNEYRKLLAKYAQIIALNEALETNYTKLRLNGAKETANLTASLEAKKIELQQKEDELNALELELRKKEEELIAREERVHELEEIIRSKDAAVAELRRKVAEALNGFMDKGLSVEERNGKIYVSLEAKLLFASGSTAISSEGKTALIDLAKVLEDETELEIIVEGHTDTDKMGGTSHPKNNWELSVLRSTSVIEIILSNSSLNAKQLMAAGRSEFHPVDENNKAKNRRIEIIISPDLDELYEIISND